ncbi:DUF1463 family protein (plasmid) [Borrelia miyamotoi]|uniref:DUF1463 family protein n=1 Tax=Borrelia miyamotoi TaxID=47466 RepID=A0AAP8YUX8_9SPIR|nr:DUF1463 family protein [Borrelia miyamotoi]AHH05462.1 Putative cytosolic protein [Borrelia miyamotoi FR64b]ATQ15257.1 DUF1463 family protein [Borrelia miyamotoi]ATQ16431.1 DUF1463 family protein [Borrelia miyamotoi]ATQ17586.1 DUF1463 family protein [Borrelia miyamotoi]ATQ18830.1 DUF1463 family protein [Borrelia miyamotoi]
MKDYYSLDLVFFSFSGVVVDRGKLQYSTSPSVMAIASTEERNIPIPSFRDPRTVVHIFNLEITKGSFDYKVLTKLSNIQFYSPTSKIDKLKPLVFNDQMGLKIVSNHAFFSEIPNRGYTGNSDTVNFIIHAIDCEIESN